MFDHYFGNAPLRYQSNCLKVLILPLDNRQSFFVSWFWKPYLELNVQILSERLGGYSVRVPPNYQAAISNTKLCLKLCPAFKNAVQLWLEVASQITMES